jgi:DNA polymerase-1
MDSTAPLPPIADQPPTWTKAAALAKEWKLNALAERLDKLASAD